MCPPPAVWVALAAIATAISGFGLGLAVGLILNSADNEQ